MRRFAIPGLAVVITLTAFRLGGDLTVINQYISIIYHRMETFDGTTSLVGSTFLVVIGNYFRALRSKELLEGTTRADADGLTHFRYLNLAVLVNMLLPFRLGEFARAIMLGRHLGVSYGISMVVIALERIVDIWLVSLVLIIVSVVADSEVHELLIYGVAGITLSSLAALTFVLLVRENRLLLQVVSQFGDFLNAQLGSRVKHAVWSLIDSFRRCQVFPRIYLRYLIFMTMSWLMYGLALLMLIRLGFSEIWHPSSFGSMFTGVFFLPQTLLSIDSPDRYQESLIAFFGAVLPGNPVAEVRIFSATLWLILFPISATLGLVLSNPIGLGVSSASHKAPARNLSRPSDLTSLTNSFVRDYFNQHEAAKALNQLARIQGVDVKGYLKGGSEALTVLIERNGIQNVRKVVALRNSVGLSRQAEWLRNFEERSEVVSVLGAGHGAGLYYLDLAYDPTTLGFFSYLHSHSISNSLTVLDKAIDFLHCHVYRSQPIAHHPERLTSYLDNRLFKRVTAAAKQNEEIHRILGCDRVIINGAAFSGFWTSLNSILANDDLRKTLEYFSHSNRIHGDFTVDNLLVQPQSVSPVIIDPSDDNEVTGAVIDFARLLQSLIGGYEFLNAAVEAPIVSCKEGEAEIWYHEMRSAQYVQIANGLMTEVKKRLSEPEIQSLTFHVGVLYSRMLTHQIRQRPVFSSMYLAKSIEFLNAFATKRYAV